MRLKNLAASATVVALACALYFVTPGNRIRLDTLYSIGSTLSFTGADFLIGVAGSYSVLLAAFYLSEREPSPSKSVRFLRVTTAFLRSPARFGRGLQYEERLAVLATLLKGYFAPMMVMSLMFFCVHALENGAAMVANASSSTGLLPLFNRYGYWLVLQIILFIDVLVFTFGYLVELPQLHNEIRSVDPSLLGWTAALICYPPFNTLTGLILGSEVSDFPQFDNSTAHVLLNVALLVLMATYASASVALGFKGSNLTHRGIVSRGPYALVRHPAYVCKNLAWWIASIPLVAAAFEQSLYSGIQAIASVAGWTMIYILRALTEEDHLRSVDETYATYAAKVRHRFIPGMV